MTAHDRALEIGAAAFDFGLTAAERRALDSHLASCAACRASLEGMADDARRLISRPVRRMAPARSAAVRATLERPRRAMSPAMVLVAAALLLLLAMAVAAVGAEIVRRLDESRLAIDPAPSGLATPGPSATAADAAGWTLAAVGSATGIPFEVAAIDVSAGRWIAVGARTCVATGEWTFDCTVPIASSADGITWSVVGQVPIATAYVPPTTGPEVGLVGVAVGPEGFVAVGYRREGGAQPVMVIPDGVAWWSADGTAWQPVALGDGARPSAVVRVADAWLIGGVVYGTGGPQGAIWRSVDGRSWTRSNAPAVTDVGGYVDTMEDPSAGGIRAFARNGSTVLAGGQVCADAGLPCVAAAWISTDGIAWQRVGPLAAVERIGGLAALGSGFVATASRCPMSGQCATVVLHSADGRTWTTVPGDLPETASLVSTGATAVLITIVDWNVVVRASSDGATWSLLGTASAPGQVLGGPVLVARDDGTVDLLLRYRQPGASDAGTDDRTVRWQVAPLR